MARASFAVSIGQSGRPRLSQALTLSETTFKKAAPRTGKRPFEMQRGDRAPGLPLLEDRQAHRRIAQQRHAVDGVSGSTLQHEVLLRAMERLADRRRTGS